MLTSANTTTKAIKRRFGPRARSRLRSSRVGSAKAWLVWNMRVIGPYSVGPAAGLSHRGPPDRTVHRSPDHHQTRIAARGRGVDRDRAFVHQALERDRIE